MKAEPEGPAEGDEEPPQLFSPNRKKVKHDPSAAEKNSELQESLSSEEYETLIAEIQKESSKRDRNDDHINRLMKV